MNGKEASLAMFTVFIDDSGTDPNQSVAIASALIIPGSRIASLDRQWARFKTDEHIEEFHTSECVAAKEGSPFDGWDLKRQKRVTARVRRITKNHGIAGVSFAVNKVDFDEVVHPDIKELGTRFHYTWAIRNVFSWLEKWAASEGETSPMEYVFDWMGENRSHNKAKKEIELVMSQAEIQKPGYYDDHYSFRKRQDHPSLQCTDLIAWSYYQFALLKFRGTPLNEIADCSIRDFEGYKNAKWMFAWAQTREQLADWSNREVADPRFQLRLKETIEARVSKPLKLLN
jgi:hypothetical protein